MPNVSLTVELERFAESCVASGRYNNVSEVMRAALRLLQEQEKQVAAFVGMLEAVEAEAEREGTYDIDEVLKEIDAALDAAEGARAV